MTNNYYNTVTIWWVRFTSKKQKYSILKKYSVEDINFPRFSLSCKIDYSFYDWLQILHNNKIYNNDISIYYELDGYEEGLRIMKKEEMQTALNELEKIAIIKDTLDVNNDFVELYIKEKSYEECIEIRDSSLFSMIWILKFCISNNLDIIITGENGANYGNLENLEYVD